jgi:hypothetical protein
MTDKYSCVCGKFKTENKGAYVQHIRQCVKYQETLNSPYGQIQRRLSKVFQDGGDIEGLGHRDSLSRCCHAKMEYDKKKHLPVCGECGKSRWEL